MISDIRIIKAVRVRVRATGACVNREKVRVRAPGACVLWSKMSEDFLSARFRAGLISKTCLPTDHGGMLLDTAMYCIHCSSLLQACTSTTSYRLTVANLGVDLQVLCPGTRNPVASGAAKRSVKNQLTVQGC